MISVYGGTGFIGGSFCDLFPDEIIKIPKESREPQSKNILYFILSHGLSIRVDENQVLADKNTGGQKVNHWICIHNDRCYCVSRQLMMY